MRDALAAIEAWFSRRGFEPFAFQREVWRRSMAGESGLVYAPTGLGKTLAAWMGPLFAGLQDDAARQKGRRRGDAPPLQIIWLTPMRALAQDLGANLAQVAEEVAPGWTVEVRTGDTSSTVRARQKRRLPTALVTTPESLSLLLSYADAPMRFRSLRTVVVDEWHELLGTKRGTQTELALARLRRLAPGLGTWGLSATLGNPEEAMEALLGTEGKGHLVPGPAAKEIEIETVVPDKVGRFPWAGHMGLHLLDAVAKRLDEAKSSLVFVNTRSQAERWFQALRYVRFERQESLGLHHGSLDRAERERIERGVSDGTLWATVATSSLDLGVDFAPVEQVIQIGSPKGVARLAQRAGRSGHSPGRGSRLIGVPTHALELVEFAAARQSLIDDRFESRVPLEAPLDVLAQHLVTVALGGGFVPGELLAEVRETYAYRDLKQQDWDWVLEFCRCGGETLRNYERYARLREDKGRIVGGTPATARAHRAGIGTITSFGSLPVVLRNGKVLGTIEELFLGRISAGDTFTFAGRSVEFVRIEEGKAVVRPARSRSGGITARWMGGRMPLSNQLGASIRKVLDRVASHDESVSDDPELRPLRPLLAAQASRSRVPRRDELLIERVRSREGDHAFLYPIAGRMVHDGLATLLAWRITQRARRTVSVAANDWGLTLVARRDLPVADAEWAELLSPNNLLEDLLACLDASGLARRHFREVARVAGLVESGPPHRRKTQRQLQTSAGLVYDVLQRYEPDNLLLAQARREVLERTLEYGRLESTLEELGTRRVVVTSPARLTPLSFPLWADRIREQVSSESWEERVRAVVESLEADAATFEGEGGGKGEDVA